MIAFDLEIQHLHSYENTTVRHKMTCQVRTAHLVEQKLASNNRKLDSSFKLWEPHDTPATRLT